LADFAVLAPAAAEVAAVRTRRGDSGTREKMVERFFFDWIDVETDNLSVIDRDELAVSHTSTTTNPHLPFAQPAVYRANITDDSLAILVEEGDWWVLSYFMMMRHRNLPGTDIFVIARLDRAIQYSFLSPLHITTDPQ